MLPLNLSFRQMVKKYIPQISSEKLNDYESMIGLRYQLYQELSIISHRPKRHPGGGEIKQRGGVQSIDTGKGIEPEYPKEIELARTYRKKFMSDLTTKVDGIFENYDQAFEATVQLWIARRQFALEQGYFLQIPTSIESLRRYIKAYKNYWKVQRKTLPTLWRNRAKNFVQNLTVGKIIIYGLSIVLVIIGFVAISLG